MSQGMRTTIQLHAWPDRADISVAPEEPVRLEGQPDQYIVRLEVSDPATKVTLWIDQAQAIYLANALGAAVAGLSSIAGLPAPET